MVMRMLGSVPASAFAFSGADNAYRHGGRWETAMQKVLIGYQGPSGFVASAGVNSPYRSIDLGITGQVVKGSPGVLKTVHAMNQAASARYVKVYNKATAPLAADTPVFTIAIPAGGSVTFSPSEGVDFSAGIGLRASNLIADSDATAPTANDVLVNVSYR